MEGLLVHFDKALPSILLYRQEHQQVEKQTYTLVYVFLCLLY